MVTSATMFSGDFSAETTMAMATSVQHSTTWSQRKLATPPNNADWDIQHDRGTSRGRNLNGRIQIAHRCTGPVWSFEYNNAESCSYGCIIIRTVFSFYDQVQM
jgi:hypothetical protein